jgi:hypothetical protein
MITNYLFVLVVIFINCVNSQAAGNCSIYDQSNYTLCSQNCGRCFNPGGRQGKLCPQGSTTGYLCQDPAYACMDWTFGSKTLLAAEAAFGSSVYFGVGSFGSSDQMAGLGACFRMKVQGVDKDLIVQSINTGSDVQGNQFDLQVGDGGFGANNKCAGTSTSMYPGGTAAWGNMYGGVETRAQCSGLPPYPTISDPMKTAGDNLVQLCQYSFDKKVRLETNPSNPTILDMARVKCPDAIVELTQIQRSDDPPNYTGPSLPGFPNTNTTCQHNSWDLSYCLTRMMDCCKPSGSWITNIKANLVVARKKVVQMCTSDGYTRIDVQCGCYDCNC